MGENSNIEWCHHTFNPWEGCTKVGPGCDHCYAETRNNRFGGGNWGAGAPRRRTSPANWKKPLKWNRDAAASGVRPRVFCASLADWLDKEVPFEWLADLLNLIRQTPHLDWLLLTKRIGNWDSRLDGVHAHAYYGTDDGDAELFDWIDGWLNGKAPANVWVGATVVNQKEADRDIPKLLNVPAKVRWLSMEPLLDHVDLTSWIGGHIGVCGYRVSPNPKWIDWIVVGGESGPSARPMHPEWVRNLRDQCLAADVPFLFKQWGEWAPRAGKLTGGGEDFSKLDPECKRWPSVIRLGEHGKDTRICENCTEDSGEEVYVQKVGKKLAGRNIDCVTWDQYPEVRNGTP